MAVASAPYARVFPAASVIVQHGGFGTCAEALRAGKPTLVTPFAFDQFDTAARVQDVGLGDWVRGDPCDAEVLARHLRPLLQDGNRANASRAAAASIAAATPGADRAAELIAAL
jgi:UDP:flavonoid glycosyltransferase YjiC (YdhE family)